MNEAGFKFSACLRKRICVFIPTFRRPGGLERALAGIARQVFQKTLMPHLSVHVVDNDAGREMQHLVERISLNFPWPLYYHCEPRQGVSNVRNRCLDLLPATADALVFLDDDEVPRPHWLDELLHVAQETGAPIVQGPVRPLYVEPAPPWYVKGRFLELGPFTDKAPLAYGFSGNVLIDGPTLRRLELRFDERFNRTGGEDQHFFVKAMRLGCSIVTSAEGVADEWIPASRTTLSYMVKRRYRVGATLALIDVIEDRRTKMLIRRALRGAARVALSLAELPVLALRDGRAGAAEALGRIAYGAGQIGGIFGFIHSEYDVIHAIPAETRPGGAGS